MKRVNVINPNLKFRFGFTKRSTTKKIVLHHAMAKSCTVEDIHRWHLENDDGTWAGIGYHFFVRKNGLVHMGRPIDVIGSHTGGHNSDSIGICAEGDYRTDTMPEAQKAAIVNLIKDILDIYPNLTIGGHNDYTATDCPSKNYPKASIITLALSKPAPIPAVVSTPVVTVPTVYTVVSADTLWGISNKFKVSIADIKQFSNITSDTLSIGQKLTLIAPVVPATKYTLLLDGDTQIGAYAVESNAYTDGWKKYNEGLKTVVLKDVKGWIYTFDKHQSDNPVKPNPIPAPTPIPEKTIPIVQILKVGVKGDRVKELQQRLKNLGYSITIDGDFGAGTEATVKLFQKANGLVADGIVGEKTWTVLVNDKLPFSYPAGLKLKSKGTGYEILEKDRYIRVVRIERSALKSIDILNSKTAKETMTSMYSRLTIKPNFMINGGLYGVSNGTTIHLFIDEGKQVAPGVYSKFGLIINKDGSYKMDFYKPSTDIKDCIGSSPSLVVDKKVNIDLTGLTKDSGFTNTTHPRSALGMDDKYFYIVAIDGRRTWAKGMKINTLAQFMLDIGCKSAFNLDGGGSTRIQGKDGKPVNEPLENRAIDNAICFYLK